MSERWYGRFLEKMNRSFNSVLVVTDAEGLAREADFQAAMQAQFNLHLYTSELRFRVFLKGILGGAEKKTVLIRTQTTVYIPFSIESTAELQSLGLAEIFPKLHCATVLQKRDQVNLQTVFEKYRLEEKLLGKLGPYETEAFLQRLLQQDAVKGVQETAFEEGAANREWAARVKNMREKLPETAAEWSTWMLAWGGVQFEALLNNWAISEERFLDEEISCRFENFMRTEYEKLFYHGFTEKPVTMDRVMHYLAGLPAGKTALLCLDGMGVQEWQAVKEYLQTDENFSYKETAIFALVPTLTGIARQALFGGERRLDQLKPEPAAFAKFVKRHWPEADRSEPKVYLDISGVWQEVYAESDALGLVCNVVDNALHAAVYVQQSKHLMLSNLREYLKTTRLKQTVKELLDREYRVFLTADHGSVWCIGNGEKAPKYLVDQKAKRALLFPNATLASLYKDGPEVLIYSSPMFLGEAVAVFPRGRKMFAATGVTAISHGGIHPEEVVVPFVEVTR